MVGLAPPDFVREGSRPEHQAIQPFYRNPAGTFKVHEQHSAQTVRIVVHQVGIEVVEHHGPALPPAVALAPDLDPAPVRRLGHDQPQVQAQDAVIRAGVQRDPLAGLEDREEGAADARDPFQRPCRGRTAGQVAFGAQAVAHEEERLPLVIRRDHAHIR
ncbi:hypothetical protein G6F32_013930 [Rhizopus arrhizus]|nr:hypothetical protein G6F32_013930 [Rhizopus arrhizus]